MRELAVHHEHRARDLGAALGVVQRALERLEADGSPTIHRVAADFRRRRDRLHAKRDARSSN
jgi:DNA-binding transcriptional MerR regulator